jgi:hypothetical protein
MLEDAIGKRNSAASRTGRASTTDRERFTIVQLP